MKETIKVIVAYVVVYTAVYVTLTWLEKLMFRKAFQNAYNKEYQKQKSGMSVDEACKILGIKKKDLKKMSKDDLKRAYWKKAKAVHPDKPEGNENKFKETGNAWDFMKAAGYAA